MSKPRSELDSFNPFAEHPFTRAGPSSLSGAGVVYPTGIPVNAYPGHIVAASTSPKRSNMSQSPASSQAPGPGQSQSQASPQPIQSPQPRHPPQTTRGFNISSGASPTSSDSSNTQTQQAIFESFRKDSLTPDLDDLPLSKRRPNAWGTKELEESVRNK